MSINRQYGVTIIELIMFMVIMGVAAAGIIGLLNLSTQSSADPVRRKQAMMVAEALMEEVQLARFSQCASEDPSGSAPGVTCTTSLIVGSRPANAIRPYGNVADYATALNTPQRSFAVDGTDRDVNGNALGVDQALAPITTTVTLNVVNSLGPAGMAVSSTASDLQVLLITIIARYGTGNGEFVQLDGYRTRYAPNYAP